MNTDTDNMTPEELRSLALDTLEDMKALDIRVMDVREITSIADYMIIASGTSSRHVASITQNLVESNKKNGQQPIGVEGEREGQWALVDMGDVIIHVMLPDIREFYQLEKLWSITPAEKQAQSEEQSSSA